MRVCCVLRRSMHLCGEALSDTSRHVTYTHTSTLKRSSEEPVRMQALLLLLILLLCFLFFLLFARLTCPRDCTDIERHDGPELAARQSS